jgi:hypothetical protein
MHVLTFWYVRVRLLVIRLIACDVLIQVTSEHRID